MLTVEAHVGRVLQPPETDAGDQIGYDLGPTEMTARDALSIATHAGAQVMGRQEIGYLAPGM